MKKIFFFIIFIPALTLNSYSSKLKDCIVYSKLNPKYFSCKATNVITDTANYQKKEWSKETNKLLKKG